MTVMERFSLKGKTALVTGAKRGIGRGISVALAEAGADIIGVSATLDPTGSDDRPRGRGDGSKILGLCLRFLGPWSGEGLYRTGVSGSSADRHSNQQCWARFCARQRPTTPMRCGTRSSRSI